MAISSTSIYASIVFGNALLLFLRWKRQVTKLPPGPLKLPLIGNALNMPTTLDARVFAKLGKDHASDILHFGALGFSILVVNSREIAEDLLDKRSGIYSSRPKLTMFNLCGWGFEWVLWPYGERWRNARRMFTQGFSSPDVYRRREVIYVNSFLKKLLDNPEGYYRHIRSVPGSIALDMTYGVKINSSEDPFLRMAEAAAADSAKLVAETYLVDLLPILRHLPSWFPGANFQRRAEGCRALAVEVVNKPFHASEALVKTGDFDPALVTSALEDGVSKSADIELLKEVAATVFLAGSDTTTAALGNFFLTMVMYPDVQKKIQAEIDALLQGALPTHEDLDSFPYLEAVILETLRWRTVTPLGVPHSLDCEDVYGGYRIPAGSFVIANEWAMLHDERDYPEPEKFKPERFIKNGKLDRSAKNPLDVVFGFGRRSCPGRHIAMSTLKFTGASALSMFDWKKQVDEQGKPIQPSGEYFGAALEQPKEFPCKITPRSQQTEEVVRSLANI